MVSSNVFLLLLRYTNKTLGARVALPAVPNYGAKLVGEVVYDAMNALGGAPVHVDSP
jgi:hypothetical protein